MKKDNFPSVMNIVGICVGAVLALFGYYEALTAMMLAGIALAGYNIFKLIKRKRVPDSREDPLYKEQDDAHSAEINKIQGKVRIWTLLFWIVAIITAVSWLAAIFTGAFVPALILSLATVVVKEVCEHYKGEKKSYVGDRILKETLESFLEVAEYRPGGNISEHDLRFADFGVCNFDSVSGSDYVKGTYQGLAVEFCDIHLAVRNFRILEDGRTEYFDSPVFDGFWMIFDLGREFPADLRLWERGSLGKLVGGKGIKTQNEQFNKHFHVESDNEAEALAFLSPRMTEAILETDRQAGGKTHIRFERSGRVQIAIERDREAFALGKGSKDATLYRKQFSEELRSVTALIDRLRAIDTIYWN